MYMKKKNVSTVGKGLKVAKRKPAQMNVGKSTTNSKMKKQEEMPKQTGLKGKSVLLKGDKVKGYILVQDDGVCYQDMALTEEELRELYIILERKFGEFIGYKIK